MTPKSVDAAFRTHDLLANQLHLPKITRGTEQVRVTHKQATDLIDQIVAQMNSAEAGQRRLLDEETIANKPMPEKKHVLEVVNQLLSELERLEPIIGKTEDELGLPRSSESDRWDDRLGRIRDWVVSIR
jgi:hypothetical protein